MKTVLCFLNLFISLWANAQFVDTLIPYRIGEKWGYSNTKGEIIISPEFDFAERFQLAIRPQFEFVGVKDTLLYASVEKNGEKFYINQTGDSISIILNYTSCGFIACEEFGSFYQENRLYGFRFDNGTIIPSDYKHIKVLSEDLIIVKTKQGGYGLINSKNEIILTCEYDKIELPTDCFNGILIYKKNGLWGIFNINDKITIPPKYIQINGFTGNIAYIKTLNNLLGCINQKGFEYFRD